MDVAALATLLTRYARTAYSLDTCTVALIPDILRKKKYALDI